MAKFERVVKLVAVGRMRDRTLAGLCDEFLTRSGAYGRCECIVVPDSDVAGEGRAILRELAKERNALTVALDETGREFSTAEFAEFLERADRKIVFVIGGPFGLSPEVKAHVSLLWALSKLTFTHELARLLFCEQLYRGLNLLNGGSYHHR
ncbi:MAG: 23S rRNA (pseudouridine(1915)-N(3))-methyltransferase RlmH [Lentisphaeria bacterium]|nr:23S rRNA (pseudouridine(1915)-N(3))-methyltransferase RlmH [Lentisphaeria bacterium]